MRLSHYILIAAAAFSACSKKDDSPSFEAQPAVYFIYSTYATVAGAMDSLTYTFVEKNSTVEKDTIWLMVRIAGEAAGHDRSINIQAVADSSTAVKDVHYRLLDYSMPSGEYETQLGVVLMRDPSLRDEEKVLTLRILPSQEFPASMKPVAMDDGRYHSRNVIRIIFSDKLIKPANWDTYLVNFFGSYSNEKFRFIAGVLGRSSFPNTGPDALKFGNLQYFQTVVRNALLEYNEENGPLIDENGQPVLIP